VSSLVSWNPFLSSVGDFNGDGHTDLIMVNGDRVLVRFGAGNGTFGAEMFSGLSAHLHGWNLAVGDVNRDGKLDIASGTNAGWGLWFISVALGNGDGTFSNPTKYNMPCCGGVRTTSMADLNGDGWLDLIGGESDSSIRVYLNNGDGTFPLNKTQTILQAGNNPQDSEVGDFNNDGKMDVAFANRDAGGSIQVMLGDGAGNLSVEPLLALAPGEAGRNLAVADLNGDHCDDIAHVNMTGMAMDVYMSACNGSFGPRTSYVFDSAGPFAYKVSDNVVDLNGDGAVDLLVANGGGRGRSGNALFVLPGNGDGTFGAALSLPNPVEPPPPPCCPWVNENMLRPNNVFVTDLNEDGRADIVTGQPFTDRPFAAMLNTTPVADHDTDGDGVPDDDDAFPTDPAEWQDSDGDGVGDNRDAFPNDPTETRDSDGDGYGDNADRFPTDPTEWADSDNDGVGDNRDLYPDDSSASTNLTVSGVVTTVPARNGAQQFLSTGEASCMVSAKNHGQYVSCVGKVLNSMKAAGTITAAEKDYLQSVVAQSPIGKK
jgi:hypothetical protein